MTLSEARYVVAHREMYTTATFLYALEIIESAERQGLRRMPKPPPMRPHMIRADDELWADVLAEAEARGLDVSAVTRRFWLRFTRDRRAARKLVRHDRTGPRRSSRRSR